MRGAVAIGLLLSLAGCDVVLGIEERMADAAVPIDTIDASLVDLDMDGVPDATDPCIHAAADLLGDLDADGISNASDTCPYDAPDNVDPDGDLLGDECDPFPTATDRSRCLMRFTNPTLNTALWLARPPDVAWSTVPSFLVADPPMLGNTVATTIVGASIEGETVTTYDVIFNINARNRFGSMTVWVRADPQTTSPADIGCRWINAAVGGARIAVAQGDTLLDAKPFPVPPNATQVARINARVVTTGALNAPARVTCQFSIGVQAATAEASPELPPGRLGFTVDRWLVEVGAIHVIDRAP